MVQIIKLVIKKIKSFYKNLDIKLICKKRVKIIFKPVMEKKKTPPFTKNLILN